jgi:hypothetical protein
MSLNYRTIKAFPLSIRASFEAYELWANTAGEDPRVRDERKENRT